MLKILSEKVKYSYVYGTVEKDSPDKKCFSGLNLFDKTYQIFTTIKYIKLWFGTPPNNPEIKSLLGIKLIYKNCFTGEEKVIDYHGLPLDGLEYETQELNLIDDYISKCNIAADDYITHLKFTTLKGNFIEFGEPSFNDKKSIIAINKDNNIILDIKGEATKQGIRNLKFTYMNLKDFLSYRLINIFKLKFLLDNNKEYEKKFNNPEKINKLNDKMKCFFNCCKMPKATFEKVVQFLLE